MILRRFVLTGVALVLLSASGGCSSSGSAGGNAAEDRRTSPSTIRSTRSTSSTTDAVAHSAVEEVRDSKCWPSISIPEVSIAAVDLPAFTTKPIELPAFTVPELVIPAMTINGRAYPERRYPARTYPARTIPGRTYPAVRLPAKVIPARMTQPHCPSGAAAGFHPRATTVLADESKVDVAFSPQATAEWRRRIGILANWPDVTADGFGSFNEAGFPKNQFVRPYLRRDGTFVQGYWRNSPSDGLPTCRVVSC